MAKTKADYGFAQPHPGLAGISDPSDMRFPRGTPTGGASSNPMSKQFGSVAFQGIGNGLTYLISDWTVSIPNTGDAVANNTSGGVLITAGSDGAFCSSAESITLWAPVVAKKMFGGAIIQMSDITTVGFDWGFGVHNVAPQNSDYTDTISVRMAVGAGTMVGRVRGGSGTAAASATLNTAAATTDFYVGFDVDFGTLEPAAATSVTTGASSTTQTLGSTAGLRAGDVLYFATTAVYSAIASITSATAVVVGTSISTTTGEAVTVYRTSGTWYAGATPQTATGTAFTSAQLVQLAKIVRASPSMYHCLTVTGSAGNPTGLYQAAYLERDR